MKQFSDVRKKWYILGLLLLLPLAFAACGKGKEAGEKIGYEIIDDQKAIVRFSQKPKRIVTTGLGLDGIVLGLVPKENLVAISALADDPTVSNLVPVAKTIPQKILYPTAEAIFSLKPDLVLAYTPTNLEIVGTLRDLKINVVTVKDPASVEEVKDNIRLISGALGEAEKGKALIAKMDEILTAVEKKVKTIKKEERKKILLISLMASFGGIGSPFDDLCRRAGVINGIAALGIRNGQPLTKELIVSGNPDIFFLPAYNDHNTFNIDNYTEKFLSDPALKPLAAIKERRIFYPNERFIYNSSQDIVFGVAEIAHAAYGDMIPRPLPDSHISVAGNLE